MWRRSPSSRGLPKAANAPAPGASRRISVPIRTIRTFRRGTPRRCVNSVSGALPDGGRLLTAGIFRTPAAAGRIALASGIRYCCLKMVGIFRHGTAFPLPVEHGCAGPAGRMFIGMTRNYRVHGGLLGLIGGGMLLTGCMGPTYGTGKTAGEQLVEDIGSIASIAPDNTEARKIKYQPRGSLVVPKTTETALVAPQPSLADKDNGQWVEGPEEMRERLRAEATANQDDPSYRSPLITQHATGRKLSAA